MPGQIDISSIISLMDQAESASARGINEGQSESNRLMNQGIQQSKRAAAQRKQEQDAIDKVVDEQPGKGAFDKSKLLKGIDITSMIPVSPDAQAAELDRFSADDQNWVLKGYELALGRSSLA